MQPSGTYWLQNDDYIFLNGWWALALFVLLPREQPATTPCIRSPLRTGRTSRIFCQFIWMQFSSLVYESRISGELWPLLHSFTRKDFKTVLDFVVIHIEVTLNQQQHVWFCVSSFPGRRAGGWRTKTPQIPTLLWCLKASCSMKWRVLL